MPTHKHAVLRSHHSGTFAQGIESAIPFDDLEEYERYTARIINFGDFSFQPARDEPDFAADYGVYLTERIPDPRSERWWRQQRHLVQFQTISLHGNVDGAPDEVDEFPLYNDGLLWRYHPERTTFQSFIGVWLSQQVLGYFLPYRDKTDEALAALLPDESAKPIVPAGVC